jgi:alkylation response protein AidB-like acyl-CoA dehydrogenase
MDLELTDEQRWLQESIDTLLERAWPAPEAVAETALEQRRQVWDELVAFGALSIGGGDGIGAVEACLIARALGTHLASAPFVGSAALRLATAGTRRAPAPNIVDPDAAVALAVLEPGWSWSVLGNPATTVEHAGDGFDLCGEKVGVELLDLADSIAVAAALDGEPTLVVVPADDPAARIEPRASFDATLPMSAITFAGARVRTDTVLTGVQAQTALDRLASAGAVLAAAEAIGAATRALEEACRYAAERRQFGRSIASFQSVRHILADMYVRCASGWSAILYAAAAFDDEADHVAQTASIAKAYVSRAAREVAHGAMQVFGGIAFTAEHPAHRFLRRILVREQQFGDAAYHERALGRALAATATGIANAAATAAATPPARTAEVTAA